MPPLPLWGRSFVYWKTPCYLSVVEQTAPRVYNGSGGPSVSAGERGSRVSAVPRGDDLLGLGADY